MITGKIKWFDLKKGYGFITPDDEEQPDAFLHYSQLDKNLPSNFVTQGLEVEYELGPSGKKGQVQAIKVKRA